MIVIVIELMFSGVNVFLALLRAHFIPRLRLELKWSWVGPITYLRPRTSTLLLYYFNLHFIKKVLNCIDVGNHCLHKVMGIYSRKCINIRTYDVTASIIIRISRNRYVMFKIWAPFSMNKTVRHLYFRIFSVRVTWPAKYGCNSN